MAMPRPTRSASLPKTAKTAGKAVAKAGKAASRAAASASRGSRPRAAHLGPERRRPMILDAAFEVFLERGYEGASMEAIARRAGVSKPVVYSSFPGKEALFGELLRREEERILEAIAGALPERLETGEIEPLIADALTAFLQAVVDSPAAFQVIFLGAGGTDAAINRRVQRGREKQIETIGALAQAWLASQGVGDAEAQGRLLGYVVVGLGESAARALLAEPDVWTPRQLGDQMAHLVMRGRGGIGVPA